MEGHGIGLLPDSRASGRLTYQNTRGRWNQFIDHPHDLVDKVNGYIKSDPLIKKVVFVTAMHFGDNKQKGWWKFSEEAQKENERRFLYIFKLMDSQVGVPYDIIGSHENNIEHIDYHFCSLCSAKHALLDGGTFSHVIKKIRQVMR